METAEVLKEAPKVSVPSLTITQPDDWHVHFRDGPMMEAIVGYTAQVFARAIVMPNLKPPVRTVDRADAYRVRILEALLRGWERKFTPLMTLYLTDDTTTEEIRRAAGCGFVHGVKYYPAGATTNSAAGVSDITKCYAVLEEMQKLGMRLLIHGEVTDPEVDIFDREAVFIDKVFRPLRKRFPGLKMVFEHVSTKPGAELVIGEHKSGNPTGATITAHHLLANRNSLFAGGMRPNNYCLPILKSEKDRKALLAAATSGLPCFFLGTDSAPHEKRDKEKDCAHAGCYTAPHAMELYAEAFDSVGALDKLEGFASHYGADFYGLPRNEGQMTLVRRTHRIEREVPFGSGVVVPYRAGEEVPWEIQN